ncbi:MAG: hypothetical protein IE933_01740 [Sphingomonadales bacterium]|nr:hypothetical protein [Sphingomonadales bacterium]MBD3773349.1 hypothetical protein [Paracoccaceae bacterium]
MALPADTAQDPRWIALSPYEIGPPDAPLSFGARLARENGWSEDFAARVVAEYKRFCFLAFTAGHEVTPSDAVDQAWHLHLTYSRDYWQRFCPDVLGGLLHHGPTTGTGDDRQRFYSQYAQTLKRYEEAFGEMPPGDIWPSARRRFEVDPRAVRVNPVDVIILPRNRAYAIAAAGALLLAVVAIAATLAAVQAF